MQPMRQQRFHAIEEPARVQPLKAKRGGLFPEYSDAGVLDGPLEVAFD